MIERIFRNHDRICHSTVIQCPPRFAIKDHREATMTTLPVPFPRSYWVISGKLLAGFYPGAKDLKEATAVETHNKRASNF